MAITRITTGENSLPQARSGQIRVIFYAKGRPFWRDGAGGRRRTFDGLIDQFLPGKYEPAAFALRLAHKDMSLATQLGRDFNVPMRVANLALAELSEALNRGWGDRDSRSPMVLQQERAGVEIRVDPKRIEEALERGGD